MNDYLTIIIGSYVDTYIKACEYPIEGSFSHGEVVGHGAGGCPLNVGCIASMKDVNVKALDMLGTKESTTPFLLDELHKYKVDTSHILLDENTTNGQVFVISTGDKRTMFVCDPKRPYYNVTNDMQELLNNSQYMYSLMHMIERSFQDTKPIEIARSHKAKMIFDGTSKYDKKERRDMLYNLADGVFINHDDYQNLVKNSEKDPKEILFGNGCEFICITDSINGADLYTKDKVYHADVLKLDEVIDSTGAGDAFAGCFISSLMKGYSYPKCLSLASASGAYACTKIGGLAGAITEEELMEFVNKHNYEIKE